MAYQSTVLEVMIASPSDVQAERFIVREVLADWNALNSRERRVTLLPVGWDTHSAPDLAGRPQQLINERVLAGVDILVGIFWTKIGSPTGKAVSGSVEEIQEHRRLGKPVMLYFSSQPAVPGSIDADQYAELTKFRDWALTAGLVSPYENTSDFRDRFGRELHITLRDNPYLASQNPAGRVPRSDSKHETAPPTLSEDAFALLNAGAQGAHGMIMVIRHMGGTDISAGKEKFGDASDRRSIARWEAAVDELYRRQMLRDINGKREIFELTDIGYRFADLPQDSR